MSRTFVIGDIHGAYIPLKQCLERSGFDRANDTLITIGDICDGWPYVYECIEELLEIPGRIDIVGNHDQWFKTWLNTGIHHDYWRQGGKGTARSYLRQIGKEDMITVRYEGGYHVALNPGDISCTHKDFFEEQRLYYKDTKDRLFVHAGIYRFQTLREQERSNSSVFYWDRELWDEALLVHKGDILKFKEEFSEIFIGHTATTNWTKNERKWHGLIIPGGDPWTAPMKADIITNLDTGAGSNGKLTIMDVDTHQYWQSDQVNQIYGEYKPRG